MRSVTNYSGLNPSWRMDLDPFTGSSTTGIAANLLGRRFLGIDQNEEFLELSKARRNELNSINRRNEILIKTGKTGQSIP